MNKRKVSYLSIIILMFLILSGCYIPGESQVSVEIASPQGGESVVLNEETRIISLATSSSGIALVEIYVNGEFSYADAPQEGNPKVFTVNYLWTPQQAGNTVISVVAMDTDGNLSDPASITIQVLPSVSEINATAEPTKTVTPHGLPETQTAQDGCTNDAAFIEHVTIPLDDSITAGSAFTKIWRVNNSGTCDWVGYELVLNSGNIMDASSPTAVPMVAAGNNADISVAMVAPKTPGTYTVTWRLRTADGDIFGPELTLRILVPQPLTSTLGPNPTATINPTATFSFNPIDPLNPIVVPARSSTPTDTAADAPLAVIDVSEEHVINAGETSKPSVSCPSGTIVVSGGFAASSRKVKVWQSRPIDNGWQIYADNSGDRSQSLSIHATCMYRSGRSTEFVMVQRDINANSDTRLSAACPAESIVTGGGFAIGRNFQIKLYLTSKYGNGWQVGVSNFLDNTSSATVYAVCLSGLSGSTRQVRSSGMMGEELHSSISLTTDCPGGTYVTGGGFEAQYPAVYVTNSSWKRHNGWQTYAINHAEPENRLVTFAICYEP